MGLYMEPEVSLFGTLFWSPGCLVARRARAGAGALPCQESVAFFFLAVGVLLLEQFLST